MTGKRYGYARVSSDDQDLTIQREQLAKHGCDVVLFEKASGKSREGRPRATLTPIKGGRTNRL
jgi:DNA invertase Pin-like site-specific DNA recombinase